ncbi:MAG: RNA methyltransferase [Planctomycetes bacterium]|nr:RNA methyltransferase [Planctomycetota bacterium]
MSAVNSHNENFITILVAPRDDANVGAAARALKNCGFVNLSIVRRRKPGARARRMAVHAEDVLERARLFVDFKDAIRGASLVVGFTARPRKFGPELQIWNAGAARKLAARSRIGRVALVFGPEDSGLADPQIAECSALYAIPASPGRPIYNLAQAVLLIAHCLAFGRASAGAGSDIKNSVGGGRAVPRADRGEIVSLMNEFARALDALGYAPARTPHDRTARILGRLRRQMERACADGNDIQLWRGFLARIGGTGAVRGMLSSAKNHP